MLRTLLATLLIASLTACASIEPSQQSVEVYFVGDTGTDLRLFSESKSFSPGDGLLEAVVADLVSGKIQPKDPDYVNLWDSSNSLIELKIEKNLAIIDLNLGKLNVGAEAEQRAIDQLLWTISGIEPTVTAIKFQVSGNSIENLAGHVDASGPIQIGNAFETLSSVQITSVTDETELANPITIFGQACTFEANVSWALFQNGAEIDSGSSLAEQACPTRSDWSVILGELKPGDYVFEVYDISAKDGSVISKDSKGFRLKR